MGPASLTIVQNELEAEMLCGMLRTSGIACSYTRTNIGAALMGALATGGQIEVLVDEHDLTEARKLIPR